MKQQTKFKRPNGRKRFKAFAIRTFTILSSLGAFGVIVATAYSFLVSDTKLVYEKPYGRSYVF